MKQAILSSIILLLVAGNALAQAKAFQLRNGTVVAGTVLKETPSVFFVDLGYAVMSLPRDQVATYTVPSTPLSIAAVSPQSPKELVSLSDKLTTLAVATSVRPTPSVREFESINEMIASCARSIGVVATPYGLGAGFLIDSDGRMLTNFHVVEDERFCEVTLFLKEKDRTVRKKFDNVEVLASSALLDIALVKIPVSQIQGSVLPALSLSTGLSLDVGSSVLAIGNPGMGATILEHSVSEGIVSSLQRNINDVIYIQTTAAVNPGNSGGPLLDTKGRIVGLVTYKAAFQENIAFALPVYYIAHFLANEEAYAVTKLHPNTGFRYLPPE